MLIAKRKHLEGIVCVKYFFCGFCSKTHKLHQPLNQKTHFPELVAINMIYNNNNNLKIWFKSSYNVPNVGGIVWIDDKRDIDDVGDADSK